MNGFSIVQSLNDLLNKLKTNQNKSEINFFSGELLQKTAQVCAEIYPYQTLVLLFSQNGFSAFGEKFINQLKSKGLKPVSVIVPENYTAQELSFFSALPENVRAVVSLENELIPATYYVAGSLDLACVLGIYEVTDKSVISPFVYIKEDKGLLQIALPKKAFFVFDQNLKFDNSVNYSVCVSKIVSLFDIKLKQYFKIIDNNPNILIEFSNLLIGAINVLNNNFSEREQKLIQNRLGLELIETLICYSALVADLESALCFVKLIYECLDRQFFIPPNYVERARAYSARTGAGYTQSLRGLKLQLNILEQNQAKFFDIEKGFIILAQKFLSCAEKITNAYFELGGVGLKSARQTLKEIYYLGDSPFGVNAISLLREKGALEKIKV